MRTLKFRTMLVAAATVAAAAMPAAAHAAAATHPATPAPAHVGAPGGKVAIGFFTQWSIYSGFTEKALIADGAASKLTEINYAFSSVSAQGLCTSGDSWADYQRPFPASDAVNGVADAPGQTLAGNFNQLRELKQLYPHLKIVMTIGGWSWSGNFSSLASTAAGRQAFVNSCVDQYINGNIPGLPAGAAKGIFDGIDIDWEYPNEPGNNNPYGPQDTPNFTALMQTFRGALDQAGQANGEHYALTADVSPNQYAGAQQLQLPQLSQSLDWFNVMAIDFHGAWEKQTDFSSNLLPDPNDAQASNDKFSVLQTVQYFEQHGVPGDKIALELPYYGHAWVGVPNVNNGLYQPATGPATTDQAGYNVVVNEPGTVHYDARTASIWKYDPVSGTFYTYDTPQTIFEKGLFIDFAGLRGASVWSLDGDTTTGDMTNALAASLHTENQQ